MNDLDTLELETVASGEAEIVEHGNSPLEKFLVRAVRSIPGLRSIEPRRLITAFHGSAWTFAGYGGSQLLRLTSMVILARHLLGPKAFGLVALVNVFISGLNLLTDLGIGTDIIQHRRGDEAKFVDTAFVIQACRGAILWIIASCLAYPFARFYHQPQVLPLALAASITVLASGLTSGSIYTLMRHVRLKRLTLLRMAAEAAGLIVSVVWAILSPTAWSLVVGRVTAESFFAIGSHFITDQKMSWVWDRDAAKDIMAFGVGMFASSATYFLAGEAERLVVGKFVDLVVLGCFSLALSITSAATSGMQQILQRVFYPMIASSARESQDVARRHYTKVRLILLIICGLMALTFIAGGKWIVAVLLGPKYLMAGWILQLLGFRAALELFTSTTTQMLFALGTSKYAAAGNLSKLAFLAVGLTVAFGKYGFTSAIWVLAISPIFAYIPLLFGIRSRFRTVLWTEITTFASLLVTAGIVSLGIRVLHP
jgi:O-antigen/teichoic acid export membrane protein